MVTKIKTVFHVRLFRLSHNFDALKLLNNWLNYHKSIVTALVFYFHMDFSLFFPSSPPSDLMLKHATATQPASELSSPDLVDGDKCGVHFVGRNHDRLVISTKGCGIDHQ